jgi:hypothetical protein
LQLVAERQGCKQPDPEADGEPLPAEQYEARIENLRGNFERLGLPGYEERTSRRHGGIEFVFHPCPLGGHDSGNNTGLITVAPSGRISWHCFHSSHTTGRFTFLSGPEVIVDSCKLVPNSVEERHVEFPPDSVPRLEIDHADYIDFLARELTDDTNCHSASLVRL